MNGATGDRKWSVAIQTFHAVNYRQKRTNVKSKRDIIFGNLFEPAAPTASETGPDLPGKGTFRQHRQKGLKRWGYRGIGWPRSEKDPNYPLDKRKASTTGDVGHALPCTDGAPRKLTRCAVCAPDLLRVKPGWPLCAARRSAVRSTTWFSGTLPSSKPRDVFRAFPGRHRVCRLVFQKTIDPRR